MRAALPNALGPVVSSEDVLNRMNRQAVKRKQSAASELRALRRMQSVVLEGTASGEDGQALPPLSAAVVTGEGPLAPPAPDSALEPDNGVEDDDSVYQPPSPPTGT
ncbi:hypothetical protein MRX96_012598 [Rhipicephalus microplus]